MFYLLKTEPSTYSFSDLLRDKATVWDGVANPVALRHLRAMHAGDKLIIYHTGEEKSAVGMASVISADNEPKDPKNPRVKIEAGKPLPKAVTLAEMKANRLFKESPLLRQGRLSVVPLTAEQYAFLTGRI